MNDLYCIKCDKRIQCDAMNNPIDYNTVTGECALCQKIRMRVLARDKRVWSSEENLVYVSKNEQQIYHDALRYFGLQSQVQVAMEELAELSAILSKYHRKRTSINRDNLVDEMADALIMIQQMKIAFKITDHEIVEHKRKKLHRLVWLILNYINHHPPINLKQTQPLVDKLHDLEDVPTGC